MRFNSFSVFTLFLFLFLSSFILYKPLLANDLQSIDYYQENEISKMELTFSSEEIKAKRFHVVEDKQIIVDIENISATERVMRGFDTSEFSGSVVYVSPYRKPGNTKDLRISLQLRDNVRSVLERKGNKLILLIENRFGAFSKDKIDELKDTEEAISYGEGDTKIKVPKSSSIEDILENVTQSGAKKYVGKRISINVKEMGVANLLKMIADSSGFNIILSDKTLARPNMTLTLNNIPWDQALDTILNLGKLVASKNGNILLVKTIEEATDERKLEEDARLQKSKKEPLVTKIFPISFADIKELSTLLGQYTTPERGGISIDNRTNSVIVKDTVEVVDRMRKIVEELDTQTPQILIEAKIVEASEKFQKDLGLKEGIKFGYDPITSADGVASAAAATGGNSIMAGFRFNSAPVADGMMPGTFVGFGIKAFKRLINLDLKLQLMESESKGKVISSPKIIAQNKKKAMITSSESTSFPVTERDTSGLTTTTYKDSTAELNLSVTPQVTNEGSIAMNVQLSKAGFVARQTSASSGPPDRQSRTLQTDVLIANGETVVIGGIYTFNRSESHSGIPFLKDIPLLGWLFRTSYNPKEEKNELIIFLTPRIINQEEAGLTEKENDLG